MTIIVYIIAFLIFIGIFTLSIFIFQYAWNHTLPVLFTFPKITFAQAFLILILVSYINPSCPISRSYEMCKNCVKQNP